MNRLIALFFVVLLILSGCVPANPAIQPTNTSAPTATLLPTATTQPQVPIETQPASRITVDMLKNFTYSLKDFNNAQVALQDGLYHDDTFDIQMLNHTAFGDLNGDGVGDALVILATNSGGSGTFIEMFAILDQNGLPVQADEAYIGDRQGINDLRVEKGRVILDYLTQGPGDGLCCPSQHRLRSYVLENGVLKLVSEQVLPSPEVNATPVPNLIVIDSPAETDPLTSPMKVSGRLSQVPPDNKLTYYVTNVFDGTLLLEGEAAVSGQPGGMGTFSFEFTLDQNAPGLIQVEVVDEENGILLGRSSVEVIVP